MIDSQNMAYELARRYILDYKPAFADCYEIILGYIRNRDLANICECSELFDRNRHSVCVFRHLRQVQAFFKKNADFSDDGKCSDAATHAFFQAEKLCRITNRRLDHYYVHRDRLDPELEKYMTRMERIIHDALGDFPRFFEGLPSRIRLTSGATATRGRRASKPYLKVTMRPVCSPRAEPYIAALYSHFGYNKPHCKLVNWNRVEAVPKNWKTHRLIACEPGGNTPLQLAFDDYVKTKLRPLGADLRFQTRNQELAKIGSVDGTVCTVDLSMASDTLALNVIHWLFPSSWCTFLMDIRTPFYRYGKRTGLYAKFSSMGNGCTFGLESLVFAAACLSLAPNTHSVYGDDIIIDTDKYKKLVDLLAFLGFKVNEEKSYHEGPFRESCGADYFEGLDVTPFYLRSWTVRDKSQLCHNINGLATIGLPDGTLWKILKDFRVDHRLPFVPYNDVSTSGIWIDVHSAYSLKLINNRYQIPAYKAYVSKRPTFKVKDSRTLFLWYLRKYHRKSPRIVNSSRVPADSHKFVRKWVRWIPPAKVTPDHLFWWSDFNITD